MRTTIAAALLLFCACVQAGQLYRHVDEKGNVTFSDRPQQADQKTEKQKSANAASSEATRQMELEKRDSARHRYEEDLAARRRADAARRSLRESSPPSAPPTYGRGRYHYDPNLPDSPPPDSERRYYYNR